MSQTKLTIPNHEGHVREGCSKKLLSLLETESAKQAHIIGKILIPLCLTSYW